MKRKLSLVLLSAFIILAFTGCGNRNYEKLLNKSSPVTINIWHYYNGIQQTQFDEMVSEFNNTVGFEKGIIVEASSKNSVGDLANSIIASINNEPGADAVPDIFGTYAETAYQIDKQDKLADLSKYFTQEEIDEYVESYIEEGSLGKKGALKIFPTAKATEVMMLNLTDWQKFSDETGVTYEDLSTWEGLVEVSEKYYEYTDAFTPDVKNDGRAFFGRDAVANYINVGAKQLGHEIAKVSEDGTAEVSVDKDTMKKLWDNFYVPFVKGYFDAESRFRTDDAKVGNIIALIGSTTGASYYPQEVTIDDEYTYPIENKVLPVPNFEGCEPFIVQQGAGMSVIKSDEKKEYACAVFLKWFTDKERNIKFSVNSGYLPVKKAANNVEDIQAYCEEANINATMRETYDVAIDEINTYGLCTSPPYDNAAEVRDYLGQSMESTAIASRDSAKVRIASGEDRNSVLLEYTDENAFNKWFEEFEKGFNEIVGE